MARDALESIMFTMEDILRAIPFLIGLHGQASTVCIASGTCRQQQSISICRNAKHCFSMWEESGNISLKSAKFSLNSISNNSVSLYLWMALSHSRTSQYPKSVILFHFY